MQFDIFNIIFGKYIEYNMITKETQNIKIKFPQKIKAKNIPGI